MAVRIVMPRVCLQESVASLIRRNERPPAGRYAGSIMTTRHALPFALLLGLAVAGCSSPAGDSSPAASGSAASPAAGAASTTHDGRKVEITANDLMKFSITEIRAKAGERISVTLVNQGKAPKFSMGHNFVLLTPTANTDAFVTAAAESPTTEYIPAAKKAEIVVATKLLGPGEKDTVTFTAPSDAGKSPFLCSFPGHAQVGMRGFLIVE
jgi:azurin